MIKGLVYHAESFSLILWEAKGLGRILGSDHTPERGRLFQGGCNQMLFGSLEGMRLGAGPLPHTLAALALGPGSGRNIED